MAAEGGSRYRRGREQGEEREDGVEADTEASRIR
jgi:hypothetical protein